jgi:hypothetical protein
MTVKVTEAQKAGAVTGSRTEITLITPGWGSSGYYSPAVLEQAAKDKVFPKGTQMHIDHEQGGGVGSIATLAATLQEDARWEPNWVDPDAPGSEPGRLVAENRVYSHKREMLAEMKDDIGTSIAAAAEISWGEAEGQSGKIIEALVPSKTNRVDYVTVAGRGGRISEVLEAAKVQEARNVGMWLESRMHSMFTNIADEMFGDGRLTREERITLSGALGDALSSFTATVEGAAPQLFERDLWEDPTSTATVESAAASTDSLPVPAGVTEGKEPIVATVQIEEGAHAELIEKSSRATALEAEKTAAEGRATVAEAGLKDANDTAALAIVESALEAVGISAPKTAARLAEGYKVKENGALDKEALQLSVAESVAELQVAGGAGSVRGVGESAPEATKTEVTLESATEAILAQVGLSKKGA